MTLILLRIEIKTGHQVSKNIDHKLDAQKVFYIYINLNPLKKNRSRRTALCTMAVISVLVPAFQTSFGMHLLFCHWYVNKYISNDSAIRGLFILLILHAALNLRPL
jgi:hypothetical protein